LAAIRIPYKVLPVAGADPRVPSGASMAWVPLLNVMVIYKHAKTKRIEAYVDSGAPTCLFHADVGRALGMKIGEGIEGPLGGVIGGVQKKVYYHDVKIELLAQMIAVKAGFSDDLAVAAILGRSGFFDNFTITFDPCNNPPGLMLERFYRA
jgi:hypothetical protein